MKPKINLDFANLPYLFDGEVKLTISSAIMRYIANQYGPEGFSGKSDAEKAHVDMIFGVVSDIKGLTERHMYATADK